MAQSSKPDAPNHGYFKSTLSVEQGLKGATLSIIKL